MTIKSSFRDFPVTVDELRTLLDEDNFPQAIADDVLLAYERYFTVSQIQPDDLATARRVCNRLIKAALKMQDKLKSMNDPDKHRYALPAVTGGR